MTAEQQQQTATDDVFTRIVAEIRQYCVQRGIDPDSLIAVNREFCSVTDGNPVLMDVTFEFEGWRENRLRCLSD